MDERDVEDVELAERLEAYAQARLSPNAASSARMRAEVMAAADRLTARSQVAAEAPTRPRLVLMPRWRRPVAALLAAGLTLALAVGTVAAAQPGGPLYQTRIWAETLTLPSDAADRAVAEVHRLNDRLAEAANASAAGDANAAAAALAAYDAILAEATGGTHGNAVANATLDSAVRRNIEVLTVLLGRVPDQAKDAIQNAIDQSDSVSNGLQGEPGVGGPPASNPGNGPKPTHTANPNKPTPGANATVKPRNDATKPPHPTPKPRPTPEPAAATAAPEHTPRASGRPSTPPTGGSQGG